MILHKAYRELMAYMGSLSLCYSLAIVFPKRLNADFLTLKQLRMPDSQFIFKQMYEGGILSKSQNNRLV